jgi:thioredoxin reductase
VARGASGMINFDALIVSAGHGGAQAAAVLAEFGRKPLLLGALPRVLARGAGGKVIDQILLVDPEYPLRELVAG